VSWRDVNRIVFVAAAAGFLWLRGGESNLLYTTVGMICVLVGGIPIFQKTCADILNRRTDWEMFIAAAILAALLVGNVFVALVVTLFGLIAGVIREIISFRRLRAPRRARS
jgi:cation transport ATPase